MWVPIRQWLRRATAAAGDQAVHPPPAVGDVFRFEGDRYTMVSLTPLRDPATGKVVMTGAEAQRDVERFGAGHYYRIRCNAAELVYSDHHGAWILPGRGRTTITPDGPMFVPDEV